MKTKRILLHLAILALAIVSIASGSYGIYHLRYYDSKENCLHRYTESYASVTSGVIEGFIEKISWILTKWLPKLTSLKQLKFQIL